MYIKVLKAKIHRATVTDVNIDYEGSITIDGNLLNASNILPYEAVDVYNVTNGNRFSTYAIPNVEYFEDGTPKIRDKFGNGEICVNGAAAHLVNKGDIIIIAAYGFLREEDYENHLKYIKNNVILVDENNQIKGNK